MIINLLTDSDEPTMKVNEKLRETLNLSELVYKYNHQNSEKLNGSVWMSTFETNFQAFCKQISEYWNSSNKDKRCRDLNFYLSEIRYYLDDLQLKKRIDGVLEFDLVTNYLTSVIKNDEVNNCVKKVSALTKQMKIKKDLDDYCENRDFMKNRIKYKFDDLNCEKYSRYVESNKSKFLSTLPSIRPHLSYYTIDGNCSLSNMRNTFPIVHCSGFMYYFDKIFEIYPLKYTFMGIITFVLILTSSMMIRRCISAGNRKKKLRQKYMETEDMDHAVEILQEYLDEPLKERNYHIQYKQMEQE
ncbi:PIR protein [Plasmodium vivax]|uniref:VIR protein n=1 Tax=Plasmodium vivax TaxID=5855 RepID=A0A565A4B1_PLAVI|nr:PIR protein [Plasmodium vivax]